MYMARTLAGLATEQNSEGIRTAIGTYQGAGFTSSLADARAREYVPIEDRVRRIRAAWKARPDGVRWSGYLSDTPPFGAATADHVDLLLLTIDPTPKDTIVFRGQFTDDGLPAVGQTTVLHTILSTTFALSTAEVFAKKGPAKDSVGVGVVAVFFVRAGARLLYIPTNEQECILASGCTMKRLDTGDRTFGKHRLMHILVSHAPSSMTKEEALASRP